MKGPALVFVGVAIVSLYMPDVETGWTVVVEGDRITYAGLPGGATIPADARRIDGGGRFLVPGLADMHVHVHFADELGLYLAQGITTVRNMRGSPQHLAWRDEVRSGGRPGPTVYTSGPTLGGSPLRNPAFTAVDSPAEAARVVAAQAAAGYDLVKVHSGIRREVYEAIAAAAREHGLRVAGHYVEETGIETQVREGQASLEHVGDIQQLLEADHTLAGRISAAGMRITPLIATRYASTSPPSRLGDLLAQPPQPWDAPDGATRRALASLKSAGVRFLLGTDASLPPMRPGESLGLEMRSLLAAGFTPYEVLEAATRNAGAFVEQRMGGRAPWFGTIQAGARADLLLLDHNPLDNPLHALTPRMVVATGRLYDTEELARLRGVR